MKRSGGVNAQRVDDRSNRAIQSRKVAVVSAESEMDVIWIQILNSVGNSCPFTDQKWPSHDSVRLRFLKCPSKQTAKRLLDPFWIEFFICRLPDLLRIDGVKGTI